jgi:glycosyltransferase involved in cell wall biosynthesis
LKIGVNTLFLIPGEVGGSEIYLRQTLLAIARQFQDVELVLFTNQENDVVLQKDLAEFKQTEFVRLDFRASNRYARIIREQIELPSKVRRSSVDILWSPGYVGPFHSSCPQVTSILDMQYKNYPEDLSFIARIVTNLLVNLAVRRNKAVITISAFSKHEIMKYMDVSSDQIYVTPLAADQSFVEPLPKNIRQNRLSSLVPRNNPYILTVANTHPHKNIHTLVKAFHTISNIIPHNLVLVGNPQRGEDKLQKALDKLPDKRRFIRFGTLSKSELIALYQGSDLFVFPSLYEGFGLPVLEAMISGIPVITTHMASIPEVGGDYVQYVDCVNAKGFAEKILAVIRWDDAFRAHWIKAAKCWASQFSWEKTAARTVDALQAVIPMM